MLYLLISLGLLVFAFSPFLLALIEYKLKIGDPDTHIWATFYTAIIAVILWLAYTIWKLYT